MRIDIGATVRSGDGKDVGKVDKLIVNPDHDRVSHLVVETGALFGRSVVVPIDSVRRANGRRVWLKLKAKDFKHMPDFVQTEFAAPPRGWFPPFDYPAGSVLWPGGYVAGPLVVEQRKMVPVGSVEVGERMEVFAVDGPVGEVGEVLMDQENGHVTGFVIAKGKYLPADVCIPASWVAIVGDGRLSLNRTKAEVIGLSEDRSAA